MEVAFGTVHQWAALIQTMMKIMNNPNRKEVILWAQKYFFSLVGRLLCLWVLVSISSNLWRILPPFFPIDWGGILRVWGGQ